MGGCFWSCYRSFEKGWGFFPATLWFLKYSKVDFLQMLWWFLEEQFPNWQFQRQNTQTAMNLKAVLDILSPVLFFWTPILKESVYRWELCYVSCKNLWHIDEHACYRYGKNESLWILFLKKRFEDGRLGVLHWRALFPALQLF